MSEIELKVLLDETSSSGTQCGARICDGSATVESMVMIT